MLLCYRFIMTVPPGKTTVGIDDAVNEEQYEEEESNSYVGFCVGVILASLII